MELFEPLKNQQHLHSTCVFPVAITHLSPGNRCQVLVSQFLLSSNSCGNKTLSDEVIQWTERSPITHLLEPCVGRKPQRCHITVLKWCINA